jgi:hypothetical protein
MIVVDVNLWYHGNPHEQKTLGRVTITNTMTTKEPDSYAVACYEQQFPSDKLRVRHAEVKHNRDDGALVLLAKSLKALGIEA